MMENEKLEVFEDYVDHEMVKAFGAEGFHKIRKVLGKVPNGLCGVECYYSTYPRLLAAKGVTLKRNYIDETGFGPPKEDGQAAATPAQRQVITQALRDAGFEL